MHRLIGAKVDPAQPEQRPTSGRGSIATRLLWSYLVATTLPLVLVGALLLNISLSTQRENVYSEQRTLADRTSRNVAQYLGTLLREFGSYEAVVRPSSTTVDEWQAKALELTERTYPNVLDFAVLDMRGHEQLRIEGLQAVATARLIEHGAEPSFQQAIAQNATLLNALPDERGDIDILVLLPLRNDAGTTIGLLRAIVDAAPIVDELRSSTGGTNSIAYLIDANNADVVFDDGRANFSLPNDRQHLVQMTGSAEEYDGARDVQVVGAVSPVVPASGVIANLSVVVEQPAAVAFAGLRRSLWVLALVILLVDGLVLIWALRQARMFTEPLKALRSGANLLGGGHLEHRIGVIGNDELGEVATAFNQMAGHLQESLDQIERQNDRLRHGLALARDIQLGLLPDRAPWSGEEIAVFARSIPANEVGGDFYTYIALSEGRAAIAIGDISGKGVGAALLMSLTSSAVESHGRELEHPAEVLTSLNRLLAPRLKANHMNAALMFAVFDPHEQLLRVANAGMIAPMLISEEGSCFLDVGGLPVGAYPGAIYHDLSQALKPGDMLLLMSDGVVEAHNPDGEMFGFERLETLLDGAHALGDVRTLVELVLTHVQEFIGEAEQHDDITLVAVRPTLSVEHVFVEEEQAVAYATV